MDVLVWSAIALAVVLVVLVLLVMMRRSRRQGTVLAATPGKGSGTGHRR